ncbi:MAG: AbrB/MazE/SpoVT family DNA-binding domain-containing protein [Deltaproteobacteria bacterium]|nr:AbrB/MazE/SpoVT family DNA-binding domain-containing protein [Deltaproteobacteria bacterium]
MASQIYKISIDKFGRVVLPKAIRDQLGIQAGGEFEVEEKENSICLKPIRNEAKLIKKDGWWVITGTGPITLEETNKIIRDTRLEREKKILGLID